MSDKHEWISVKDRLPDNDKRVLLYSQHGETFLGGYLVVKEQWYSHGMVVHPTHWQPLPEPPPKPDAFETWLEGQVTNRIVGYLTVKSTDWPNSALVPLSVARAIFEAGLNAKGTP